MERSEKFGFNLPSSNSDDIADINQISDNFRIIDSEALNNEELQSILSEELENKMDKFGSVFFLANGIDPSKKDQTYLGIDSPELILTKIIEESGEDTSVILKGVSTPSNASNDVVANKGYVDEALKNLDDKFVLAKDVSNIMAKSPNHYNEKTIHKGQWWKSNGTLGTDNRYNAHEPILVPNGKVLFSTYADGSRRFDCIREGLITDINDNIIEFDDTKANWEPFVNNYGQDVYVRVNIFNENFNPVYGKDIQIEVVDSVDDVAIHDYVPHPYGWYLINNTEDTIGEKPYHHSVFADEVTDTVNKVKSKMDAPCFAFAYITDTHYKPDSDYYMGMASDSYNNIKKVCEKVPLHCIINGGDVVHPTDSLFPTQEDVDNTIVKIRDYMLKANENVFFTCGNHDGIGGGVPQTSNYMSMFLHNQDKVEVGEGGTYYYFDYSAVKLRCIFLDTSKRENGSTVWGISNTQYDWLENTINSTPENYKVMLFSHIPPSPSSFENGVTKYDFSTNRDRTLTLLNNFHNGSRIVGWFCGHEHFDWLPTKEYSGCDFPVIISTSNIFTNQPTANHIGATAPSRAYDTITQDAWNAVVYRPDEAKLYVYRFGAGDDRIIDL